MGTDGKITEQGTFKQLDAAGGYVSNFNLPPPDWAYIPLHGSLTDQKTLADSVRPGADMTKLVDLEEDDASRRMGDLSIYLYYVQSIGWTPTIIFIAAITVYIFCVSFPSKSSIPLIYTAIPGSALTRPSHMGQLVGSCQHYSSQSGFGLLPRNICHVRRVGLNFSHHQLLVCRASLLLYPTGTEL